MIKITKSNNLQVSGSKKIKGHLQGGQNQIKVSMPEGGMYQPFQN